MKDRRIFDEYNGVGVEDLRKKLRFLIALWASVLVQLEDYFLLHFSRLESYDGLSFYVFGLRFILS